MTWIIHRGNRKEIVNTSTFESIDVLGKNIFLHCQSGETATLDYESREDATKAFGYLLEAIKRGDHLVHI